MWPFGEKKKVAKPLTDVNVQHRREQLKAVRKSRQDTLDMLDETLGVPKKKKAAPAKPRM